MTITIRLVSRVLMFAATVVLATGALLFCIASFIGSFDDTGDQP